MHIFLTNYFNTFNSYLFDGGLIMKKFGLLLCGLLTLSPLNPKGLIDHETYERVAQHCDKLEAHIQKTFATFKNLLAEEANSSQPLHVRIYDNVVDFFLLPVCKNMKELKKIKDLKWPFLKFSLAYLDALDNSISDILDIIPLPKAISKKATQNKIHKALLQAHDFILGLLETSVRPTQLDQEDVDQLCTIFSTETNNLLNYVSPYLDETNTRRLKFIIASFTDSLKESMGKYFSQRELRDLLDFMQSPTFEKMLNGRNELLKALRKSFSDDTQKEATKTLLDFKDYACEQLNISFKQPHLQS